MARWSIDDQGRPSFQALHHQSAHTLVVSLSPELCEIVSGTDSVRAADNERGSVGSTEGDRTQKRSSRKSSYVSITRSSNPLRSGSMNLENRLE
jgi:hypothetical protein